MEIDGGRHMHLAGLTKGVGIAAALASGALLLPHPQQAVTPPAPVIQTSPEVLNLDALAAQGEDLLAKARAGSGSAGITLANYKGHYTMLTARTKSGGGELHQHYADFLFVIAGEARCSPRKTYLMVKCAERLLKEPRLIRSTRATSSTFPQAPPTRPSKPLARQSPST
jgi:hypothetical protein